MILYSIVVNRLDELNCLNKEQGLVFKCHMHCFRDKVLIYVATVTYISLQSFSYNSIFLFWFTHLQNNCFPLNSNFFVKRKNLASSEWRGDRLPIHWTFNMIAAPLQRRTKVKNVLKETWMHAHAGIHLFNTKISCCVVIYWFVSSKSLILFTSLTISRIIEVIREKLYLMKNSCSDCSSLTFKNHCIKWYPQFKPITKFHFDITSFSLHDERYSKQISDEKFMLAFDWLLRPWLCRQTDVYFQYLRGLFVYDMSYHLSELIC